MYILSARIESDIEPTVTICYQCRHYLPLSYIFIYIIKITAGGDFHLDIGVSVSTTEQQLGLLADIRTTIER